MNDIMDELAAMYFGAPVHEELLPEFYEHIGFEITLYAPIEAMTHDCPDEVVALALVLQKLGFTQEESYRIAIVAADGRNPDEDDDFLKHSMLHMQLVW